MSRKNKKQVRVALCGRRNVGKSTLFNAFLGKRRAITDAHAGLTRDVLEAQVQRDDYHFLISDTPGLDIEKPDELETTILERARAYLENVDLIILLLEAPALAPYDFTLWEFLRKGSTPVLYVVNKIDGAEHESEGLDEFYQAGIPEPIPVSAKGRWNLDTLLERMADLIPAMVRKTAPVPEHEPIADSEISDEELIDEEGKPMPAAGGVIRRADDGTRAMEYDFDDGHDDGEEAEDQAEYEIDDDSDVVILEDEDDDYIVLHRQGENSAVDKNDEDTVSYSNPRSTIVSDFDSAATHVAIVGRPNAGKSSLFNKFTQKELSLVSDIPGTTRDTVDTILTYHGTPIRIIDTAGMRRASYFRGKDRSVDYYSISRAKRAIMDSHVVIHLMDCLVGVTDFDKKISNIINQYHKPVVIGVNKWDAFPDKNDQSMDLYRDRMNFLFPRGMHFPVVFCSAQSGRRVYKLLDICLQLEKRSRIRISTSALNGMVRKWNSHLKSKGANVKVQYATQVSGSPPTFILFVNRKNQFRGEFLSYVENRLREKYDLGGVPITLLLKEKENPYV